ncbi:MAG TPA: ATP-binding protein, partial [Turneriella sp.]|nr:ATP-binding protein [Turneriella sp.]
MFRGARLRFTVKIKQKFQGVHLPLWVKGALATTILFIIPFLVLSYRSVHENIRMRKEILYRNFYLKAHAFSFEVRSYLKDKVDLQEENSYLLTRGHFTTGYELPISEAARLNVLLWLSDKSAGSALIEFFIDPKNNLPRILYVERHKSSRYFIFEANFLAHLLDTSQSLDADNRIFIYNSHEEPFLSNSIENEYRVPTEWMAGIHRLFWQQEINSIQELKLNEEKFIIARYKIRDLPLVVYLARPYSTAMDEVNETTKNLVLIFLLVAVIVFLMLMYFFRDQVSTLHHLRSFIDGRLSAQKAKRIFLIGDERTEIFADIIAIREKEKRALQERDRADARTKAKGDFLASMSHEIRNPLNAILGIADLLRQKETDAEKRGYLQMIRESGDSLLRIVNDILDISKIENNRLTLEETPFDIRKLIYDLRFFYSAKAETQHNDLIVSVKPGTGPLVLGDPTRLRQILINFISNALKFTQKGRVVLRVRRYLNTESVHFFVHDSGIGISKEGLSRIFAAYEQAEASTTRKYGGTGLGLNIALRLARLMQGSVRCRSRIGKGTSFYCRVHLPQVMAATQAAFVVQDDSADMLARISGMRVLVAEDNEINQMLMVENLKPIVKEVVVVSNGKEILEKVTH